MKSDRTIVVVMLLMCSCQHERAAQKDEAVTRQANAFDYVPERALNFPLKTHHPHKTPTSLTDLYSGPRILDRSDKKV